MTSAGRTADLCIAEHRTDPSRPRRARDGLRLCAGHYKELEKLVAQLPARYNDLARPRSAAGTARGTGEPGLTVDEAAADLRTHIEGLLASWCSVVVDERGVTAPWSTAPTYTAAMLTIHLEWCAAHEWVTDMLAELRSATSRCYGLSDIHARYLDLGERCLIHTGGERCAGTVTMVIRGNDWTAVCPACRERHRQDKTPYVPQDATPYLRLSQRGQWIPAADVIKLAEMFGVPCNVDVLYQWKRRRRIIGRTGPTENLYDLRSVQRYLAQRQTEQRRIGA